jgi:hypothetical protein
MSSEALSLQDKGQLASMMIDLLDSWEIRSHHHMISLLSLPSNTPTRAIRKYRQCNPFPENEQTEEKVEHLIGIADALRTTFPRNAQMGSQWMNKPHKRFNGKSPLKVMIEEGLDGVVAVRALLDCSFAWKKYDEE